MGRLLRILGTVFALNFIAIVVGLAWLATAGGLTAERMHAVREIVLNHKTPTFDAPTASAPATQPAVSAEQKAVAQQLSLDAQSAMLDRRRRELDDQQATVARAMEQLQKMRAALVADQQALDARQKQDAARLSDAGFQDTLRLYNTMSGRQVKTIFMGLQDDQVVQYLQAMEPRAATRIIKEFKTPAELERIGTILERMRQATARLDGGA